MLSALIKFSLKHATLILVLAGAILVFAGLQTPKMPVDVFPDLNAPTVVVMTEAPGLSSADVEQSVTFPIETGVGGLPGLRRVRSASTQGLSIVWVEFDWNADLLRARQSVSERLSSVRESLPEGVHAELAPITSIAGEVMLLGVSSHAAGDQAGATPLQLRDWAEYDLRLRLLAVPGVAQVVAIGGGLPEYRVSVDPVKLAAHGVTFTEVANAAGNAHSIASAGYLAAAEHGRLEIPIRQDARARSAADLAATLVAERNGGRILLGDVADIRLEPAPARGAASIGGYPAVILSVQKAPGVNTLDLIHHLDAVLDQAKVPAGMHLDRKVFRSSDFIQRSVDNVVEVLRDAVIIVAVILILFLLSWRATLITLVALPLSLAVGLLTLWAMGLSINVMTLGGFAVAIGELVDDAIIDVENVIHRLRENATRPEAERLPAVRVILDASNEIRSAVVFATVLICMVFAPLLFLGGLEGRFFRPLGLAYIISIFASLLVALTVTPALCRLLLAKVKWKHADRQHVDGPLVRPLKTAYSRMLDLALRWKGTLLACSAAVTVGALALGATFGSSFLPAFNEGTFTVFVMAPPGTSLSEADRLGRGVEERLVAIPGVLHAARRTGRAERDEHAEPVSSSEIEVAVAPGHDRETVRAAIQSAISGLPGTTTMVGQPIEHRLSHILSGTPAALALDFYGDDMDALRAAAKETEATLKAVPGTTDVAANREVTVTSLQVRFDRAALAAAGLTPVEAADQVAAAFSGRKVGTVAEGARQTDITVRLTEGLRQEGTDLAAFVLQGTGGRQVRLAEVAQIHPERTSNLVARQNARRKAVVSCNVAAGHNLGDLVAAIRPQVDAIAARHGLTVQYGGQFEAKESATRTILWMGLGVLAAMLVILQWATGSWRAALLVMLNLPLALIGGVGAVFIAEADWGALLAGHYLAPVLSVATLVGFITLFGVAVRNGLLLVIHYRHLLEQGLSLPEAVRHGSLGRLVPILMTALTAALGLIPLALRRGEPGAEILAPLAIVVLGGLLSSTFLNLFVIPAGYVWVFARKPPVAPAQPDL